MHSSADAQYFLHFPFLYSFPSRPCYSSRVYLLSYIWTFEKNYSLYFRPMDVYRNCLKPSEPQCFDLFSVKKKRVCNIFYCYQGNLLHRKPLLPKTLEKKDCAMQDKGVTICNLPPLFLCLSCRCLLLSVR